MSLPRITHPDVLRTDNKLDNVKYAHNHTITGQWPWSEISDKPTIPEEKILKPLDDITLTSSSTPYTSPSFDLTDYINLRISADLTYTPTTGWMQLLLNSLNPHLSLISAVQRNASGGTSSGATTTKGIPCFNLLSKSHSKFSIFFYNLGLEHFMYQYQGITYDSNEVYYYGIFGLGYCYLSNPVITTFGLDLSSGTTSLTGKIKTNGIKI
jgi:hypothetical protein